MTVTTVDKDLEKLTITLVADFDAPVEQVWQLWADPRKLERWWGPPTHPATVEQHDLTVGGTVTYFMTAPDGQRHRGYWRITSVNPPKSLEFLDGFADPDGQPSHDLPAPTVHVGLTERGSGTRMELRSVYGTLEQLEQLVAMGAVEGLQQAVGQMDPLLAQAG